MELNVDGLPSTVMPLPAATLTFDLLNRKPNQYVSCLRYIRDLILVKLARIRKYCSFLCHWLTACCDLDL